MPELIGEDTISKELERACAEEPIHIIGTVQPHGFLLVVDIATTRIVQVSSGTARHWRGSISHSSASATGLVSWRCWNGSRTVSRPMR